MVPYNFLQICIKLKIFYKIIQINRKMSKITLKGQKGSKKAESGPVYDNFDPFSEIGRKGSKKGEKRANFEKCLNLT